MVDKVEIGDWCTLYHGDCRDVLPTLSPDGYAALVTDPPFGIMEKFGEVYRPDGHRRMQFDWDADPTITIQVVDGIRQVLPKVSSFHLFCGFDQWGQIASVSRDMGFTAKPWAWVKDCPPPAMPGNWWPSAFEIAMYGYRPGAWFGDTNPRRANVYRSDTYRYGIRASEKTAHPTQKWLPMVCDIVAAIVPPDGVAIDPFMGSGTTGAAARRHGRRFIGIEREREYFDIAAERLMACTGDGPLFEAAPPSEPELALA